MTQFSTDKIFLDIGAQMGLSTLPIAARGYKVIAVEPVSSSLDFLKKNIEENKFEDRVKILPYAAYSEKKEMEIFVPLEEDCASLSFDAAARIRIPIVTEKIQAIILDDELPSIVDTDLISFIKIDVQGAELDVIKGMKNMLMKNVPRFLFIEWDPSYMKNCGYSPFELKSYLESLNYRLLNPSTPESEYGGDLIFTNTL
jgi:FkbM family methyltransferase